MEPISMPLSALTKHHLRQSDDSLPLTCISQCRDQPPPPPSSTDEHSLPLKQIPSLTSNNNSTSNNSHFAIGGSWITKSISRHSSSSSVYSSSAEPTNNSKRQYTMTTTNSETSARSSIVSQSQESAKSMNSSVGVTSVSEGSHYSQKSAQKLQHQQKQKRRSDGLKQALSFSSLRKRENVDKNPFKWLCRRSDTSIRHSTSQLKLEQQMESEDHSGGVGSTRDVETQQQQPQVISPDLGRVIVQRMDRLEEKINIFFSGLSSASRSATNSTDLEPGDPTTIKETPQTPYTCINPQTDNDIKSHLKILTAEIAHLTKSNNNLSSCIDALGSSGLIDLLEMLSCSLERLHATVTSLREEQKQQQNIINSGQDNTEKQLESQMDLIQRLGFLLGQREEQLRHERRLNQTYRRNIEGLEKMIRSLEEEWERAMPVMARLDVHVERVGDVIERLSRGKAE